jgi:hypothetical protein
MRSRKHGGGQIPWPIWEAIERRAREEDYSSVWRYLLGCALRDIMSPQRHIFNHVVIEADPSEQDQLIDAFTRASSSTLRHTVRGCLRNGVG